MQATPSGPTATTTRTTTPVDLQGSISAASLAELHFGVLAGTDPDERAGPPVKRLGVAAWRQPGSSTSSVARHVVPIVFVVLALVMRGSNRPRVLP